MRRMSLRVRTKPPYPSAEGVVRLVAQPKPNGGFAVILDVNEDIEETNPLTDRSRTDPIFLCDQADEGFRRAVEWIESQFEVLAYEAVDTENE